MHAAVQNKNTVSSKMKFGKKAKNYVKLHFINIKQQFRADFAQIFKKY